MKDIVIYDIETKDTFAEVGSRDPKKLHISCIGAYFYAENKLVGYKEDELPLFWRRLEQCDLIVGFNNHGFDDIVCSAYFPEIMKLPSLDLLERIHASLGFRIKLDNVAQATLGYGKSGDGLQAVKLYAEGKIEELLAYCLQDVKVTKEVFDFGRENGRLSYADLSGTKEFFVDFEPPAKSDQALNLSLF